MLWHSVQGAGGLVGGPLTSSVSVDPTTVHFNSNISGTTWVWAAIPTAWKNSSYTVFINVSTWWNGTSPTSDTVGLATSTSATSPSAYLFPQYAYTSGGFAHDVYVTSGSDLASRSAFGVLEPGSSSNGAGRRTFVAVAATGVSSVELRGQFLVNNGISLNYPSTGLTLNKTPALFSAQVNTSDTRNAKNFSISTGEGFSKNFSSNIFSAGTYDNLRTSSLIGNPLALDVSQTITGSVTEFGGYLGSVVALNLIGE